MSLAPKQERVRGTDYFEASKQLLLDARPVLASAIDYLANQMMGADRGGVDGHPLIYGTLDESLILDFHKFVPKHHLIGHPFMTIRPGDGKLVWVNLEVKTDYTVNQEIRTADYSGADRRAKSSGGNPPDKMKMNLWPTGIAQIDNHDAKSVYGMLRGIDQAMQVTYEFFAKGMGFKPDYTYKKIFREPQLQ